MDIEYRRNTRQFVADKLIGGYVIHSRGSDPPIPGITLSDGQATVEFTEAEARQAITALQTYLNEWEDGTMMEKMRQAYGGGKR
jgi:hypothetical protein